MRFLVFTAQKIIFCVLVLFSFNKVWCQQSVYPNTRGYWLSYMGDNKINGKWGLHTELQLRSFYTEDAVETLLLRAGINHYINSSSIITLGYGYIWNNPNEEYLLASEISEHRIWQQLIMRQKTQKLFVEHRYRLEQRFIENITRSTTSEEHRIRYRIQAIFPMYTFSPALRHFFLVANNELFINFRSNPSLLFDRNRLFAGLGYQVSPKLNFQAGYLNQRTQSPGRSEAVADDIWLLSVSYNMDDIMQTFFRSNK